MLSKPKGRNSFCGPAAMSATLGITTHYAAKLIREATGKSFVKGLYNSELLLTLKENGARVRIENINKSFNQFVQDGHKGIAILHMRGHYIAYDPTHWTDSGMHAKKKKLYLHSEFPKPKAIVKSAFFIEDHNIIEPKKSLISSPPTSFHGLLLRYGSPGLLNEFEHFEDFIPERIDNHFGDGTYAALPNDKVKEKYCSIFTDNIDPNKINDIYYWDLLSDVEESSVLERDDLASLRTILMLNGKYKFIN